MITIQDLLYKEIVWNKEKVMVVKDGKFTDIKRLEFQYEAIEKNYSVIGIEPMYDEKTNTPYLILDCE